jgi:hypothetical protein
MAIAQNPQMRNVYHYPGSSLAYAANEYHVVTLPWTLDPGRIQLSMTFNGSGLNKLSGLYSSHYMHSDGTKQLV